MDSESIRRAFLEDLQGASSSKEVEALKVKYLGKKGQIQHLMLALKEVSAELRPQVGKGINDLKEEITKLLTEAVENLENKELNARLVQEVVDVTLPGKGSFVGRRHVVLKTLDRALEILSSMGFAVQLGPDIESDYYNFEALNFPKDHPARDMHDTFYITGDMLLRTHTSNTQMRVMENAKPPIRVVAPGKCFRNEDISARSHVVFHQIEGFYIDKKATFADLLVTLETFYTKLFEKKTKMRYRPSYFPFVEPGLEVDVSCIRCEGKGCSLCKQSGWLEVCGAGMMHPEVLKSGGIDPEEYSGYAWGMGIERMAILLYGVPDIRLFLDNDLRFLQQY